MNTFYHSVRGPFHVRAGLPRQDHGRLADLIPPANGKAAAVADGHGSELHARSSRGANLAAGCAVRVLRTVQAPQDVICAIKTGFDRLVARDLERHPVTGPEQALLDTYCAPPEALYGTTLLAVRLMTNGEADVFQLGDGEIHILIGDGSWADPLPPDPDCEGSATSSLVYPREEAIAHFRHRHVSDTAAVFLYTDGYRARTSRPCRAAAAFLGGDSETLLQELSARCHNADDQTFAALALPSVTGDARFCDGFRQTMAQYRDELDTLHRAGMRLRMLEELARLKEYLDMGVARLCRLPKEERAAYSELLRPKAERYFALLKILKEDPDASAQHPDAAHKNNGQA